MQTRTFHVLSFSGRFVATAINRTASFESPMASWLVSEEAASL